MHDNYLFNIWFFGKFMEICSKCEDVSFFHKGLKGSNSDKSKIMFVAHKPDGRVRDLVLPIFDSYEVALANTKTGKNMNALLNYCNLSWKDIYWTNLLKCVFDIEPTKKEYQTCFGVHLKNQIREFNPNFIIALGSQVYEVMFPEDAKILNHSSRIGAILQYEEIQTLIYPHPQKIRPPYCSKDREKYLFELMRGFLKPKSA